MFRKSINFGDKVRKDAHDLTCFPFVFCCLFKREKNPLQFQTLSSPNRGGQDCLEFVLFLNSQTIFIWIIYINDWKKIDNYRYMTLEITLHQSEYLKVFWLTAFCSSKMLLIMVLIDYWYLTTGVCKENILYE